MIAVTSPLPQPPERAARVRIAGTQGMPQGNPHLVQQRQQRVFRLLLAVAAFTLPWHIFRLNAANLTISDIAFIACLAFLLVRGRLNSLPFGSLTNLWCLGLALMLGGLLASSIVNGDPARWLSVGSQYFFAYLLLPMILMSDDRAWMHRCLVYYVLGVALSEAVGVTASLLFKYADTSKTFGEGFLTGNGRVGAFAGEPNWNGATVAFALPMLVNAIRRRQISTRLGLLCAAALIWGLLASASFTSFSAAMLALALAFLVSNPLNFLKFGLPLIAVAAIYIALGLPLPGAFEERVAGALETGDMSKAGSFVGRSTLVREAWDISGGTIVIGLGVDGFRHASVYGAPVHFFPLLILTEGGVVALIGVLLLIGTLLWSALRAIRVNRDDGAMAMAVLAVFCVFTFAIPHMYTRLWIGPVILALAASYARNPRVPAPHSGIAVNFAPSSAGTPAGAYPGSDRKLA